MDFLETLDEATRSPEALSTFISQEINSIYDFFLDQPYQVYKSNLKEIDKYIERNLRVFRGLDLSVVENRVFLLILLDVCERFGFNYSFETIYNLLNRGGYSINHRYKATFLTIDRVNKIDDIRDRLDEIFEELEVAYETEEDNEDKVVNTFVRFFAHLIRDFGQFNIGGVQQLKKRIVSVIQSQKYHFLNHSLIEKTFGFKLKSQNHSSDFDKINHWLDDYLLVEKFHFDEEEDGFIIEDEDSEYALELNDYGQSFDSIKSLNNAFYNEMSDTDTDTYFYRLQRGVKVLTDEKELIVYFRSYGRMHKAKMQSAINQLPSAVLTNEVDVIDWGCGQGVASIVFLDSLLSSQNVNSVTLIEPSELAIKRAALHLQHLGFSGRIKTIHKDLDSLEPSELKNLSTSARPAIHLFSNIIDIEYFSLQKLIQNIEIHFKGLNYFVIASPYINDFRTTRINSFMNHFKRHSSFECLSNIDNPKGTWMNGWTRVIRVFKVEL